MNPRCDKLPSWERRQVHEEPGPIRGKDCRSVWYSTMETVAARWAGSPEVGDAELGLKDRRGRGTG